MPGRSNPIDSQDYIEVIGAREHNLKDIDVRIPRNKLVVITGLSGSGKSSLAFDTIYAEGQRRYMETFSSYARQFIGEMERPEVERINGLSPVISIEQKTTGRNPRSTVGTITEIYDFLRLLYARIGEAYSYATGKKMERFSEEQMRERLLQDLNGRKISLLAPMVRGRKGHYRELFEQVRKQGYTKIRVDGAILDVVPDMQVDRYKVHDIEVVVDRLSVNPDQPQRLFESLATALKTGNGVVMVLDMEREEITTYSKHLFDLETGISYEEPSPNTFSFNSPYGACPTCNGLGFINQVDMDKVIPDPNKSIADGGFAPLGELRENLAFKQLKALAKDHKFSLNTPIKDIPEAAMEIILRGGGAKIAIQLGNHEDNIYNLAYEGLIKMLER